MVLLCFLNLMGVVALFSLFLRKLKNWEDGERRKIWKDLGERKNMIKIYLDLNFILLNKIFK